VFAGVLLVLAMAIGHAAIKWIEGKPRSADGVRPGSAPPTRSRRRHPACDLPECACFD